MDTHKIIRNATGLTEKDAMLWEIDNLDPTPYWYTTYKEIKLSLGLHGLLFAIFYQSFKALYINDKMISVDRKTLKELYKAIMKQDKRIKEREKQAKERRQQKAYIIFLKANANS